MLFLFISAAGELKTDRFGLNLIQMTIFAHLDKRLFGSTSKVIIDWFSGGFCLLL